MSGEKVVLVVDDEDALAQALRRTFQKHEINTLTANSFAEALEVFKNHEISLCVTDLALPGKSGMDLLKYLRSEDRYRELPVIVHSTFSVKTEEILKKYKPFALFQKPAEIEKLVAKVREGLGLPLEP